MGQIIHFIKAKAGSIKDEFNLSGFPLNNFLPISFVIL